MTQPRTGAELVERAGRRLEPRALRLEQRVTGFVGGPEMRVDGLERQIPAAEQFGQRALQVVVPEAKAIHAGVDFQVVTEGRAALGGALLQRPARGRTRDRRRQIVIEHTVEIADAQRAEHQDRRVDAGFPEIDALFDVRHREHDRAGRLERRRDPARAVAVGVGLDDGDDSRRQRGTAAGLAIETGFAVEIRADGVEVGFERCEINAGCRAADHEVITTQGLGA